MKILIFGLTLSSSWGNGHATPYRAIVRALAAMGHDVRFYEKDVPYYRSRRDFSDCDFCQLLLYQDWSEVRNNALRDARSADIVITASYLPQGAIINDDVLALAGPLRVFYDLDTPITLRNLEAGELEYLRRDQISAFDLVLSFAGGAAISDLEHKWGVRMARPLYGCVDPDAYLRVQPFNEFCCDLSYMGTYAVDRQQKLDELFLEPARRHPERQFMLAGSLYPEQEWPENVRHRDHVAPQSHPAFYSSSRLTLNITREEMARTGWCPSGRFFEAAACGTPILTDWWEGLDWFFDVVRDLRVVACADHVEAALQMSDEELCSLAAHARERTLDDHTGKVRAKQLLTYVEDALSPTSEIESEVA